MEFQRARRPEQVASREAAILAVARELLAERRLADISLRELSARVGLAKSNVLRYFESREAIFLTLLDQEWAAWLDALEHTVPAGRLAAEDAVARAVTDTLAARPLLCELFSSLASVLEHNISVDTARAFKRSAVANAARLRGWLLARLTVLDEPGAHHVAGAIPVLAGALWAYERPSAAVAQVTPEFGGLAANPFAVNLFAGLRVHLAGATTLAR